MIRRKTKSYIIVALICAITLSLSLYSKYKNGVEEPLNRDSTEKISFIIKKGDTARDIADSLQEKGIIRSDFSFYWYSRMNGLAENIISGRFLLSPSMNVPAILSIISDVKKSEAVITIQEGLKIRDIDAKLVDLGLTKAGEFMTAVRNFNNYEKYPFLDKKLLKETLQLDLPLEGYLYPDTYFLEASGFMPDDLISKALNNFNKKISAHPEILTQSKIKMHDLVTIASILEKEVRGDTDRAIVSGILWKRIASGWKLDADATLLYTKVDNKITSQDLAANNPYNTRKVKGLPPGPICNPSINSILAALNPAPSSYWFYLSAKDGSTKYAVTNDEQNANVAKYL